MKGSAGHDQIATQPRPGVFQTHLWPEMLPDDIFKKNIKIIRVIRNPKDVAVSYYHFTKMNSTLGALDCTWEQYFKAFVAGDVGYGSFFEHYKKWIKFREHPHVMCVSYEEYIKNPSDTISNFARFLGKPLKSETVMELTRILSFSTMKANPKLDKKLPQYKKQGVSMRKGVIGDWKNYFTEEQNEVFDPVFDLFAKETGYQLEFE